MSHPMLGVLCGLAFGTLTALAMARLEFPDKRAALVAAFVNRFAIGFLIPVVMLPVPAWIQGLVVALLLSVPDAILTKAWAPILGIGAIGGVVIGIVAQVVG
jgi:hypothetical protein